MNKNNEKYTHINLIKRVNIEVLLKDCNSFSEIGNKINLPRETVYREVRRNRKLILCDTYEKKYSCVHFEECSKNHKLKHYCDPNCTRYELGICERLKKYPLVCNGCSKIGRCMKAKCLYNSEEADSLYKNLLHSSREKPHYSNEIIESINKKITGPIKERGQSVEA